MVNKKPGALIVDDEEVVCDLLLRELSQRGFRCTSLLTGDNALAKLNTEDFDVVLLDIRLPGMSGMEVLREIWSNNPNTVTIMMTAVNDINTAVLAMKWGASDYIVKPFDLERVEASIRTALETKHSTSKSYTQMDAIACGVEARLDPFSSYSKVVTERTVNIAWQLGVAQEEIQRWAVAKVSLASERAKVIKYALSEAE